ncbi:MAG: hypothetical protein IJS90_05105 [Clostridia bacterium]|nr:hypothetical protein [Clostridia bacterium]
MSSIIAFFKSLFQRLIALISGRDSGVVVYYGCPNSNKARKLQLNKTIYK